jgi:hypothetical protein
VAVPLRAFYRNEHLIVRWLPMLRLNKCAKMWYFASYLPQHSLSRHSYATQKIIRIFGMFWLVTHWAGCGWLFVGLVSNEDILSRGVCDDTVRSCSYLLLTECFVLKYPSWLNILYWNIVLTDYCVFLLEQHPY